MAFVGAIIAAIVAASEAIASVIGAIAAAIGGAIAAAGETIGGILVSVFKDISSKVGGTLGAMFHIAGLVLGSIDSEILNVLGVIEKVITTVDTFIQGILKPIENLMTAISGLFDMVGKTYTAITSLVSELHADLHAGIKGLLEIPSTISDALTSIDAVTTRSIQQLEDANRKTVSDTLIPGMSQTIADPLKAINQTFTPPPNSGFNLLKGFDLEGLGSCGVPHSFSEKIQTIQKALTTPDHLLDYLGKVLADIGWLFIYLEAAVVSDVECIQQGARQSNPAELLGIGDVVEAKYRGIISDGDAKNEVERRGLSYSRFKTLMENALWLPGMKEAFMLFWRNQISHDELVAILEKQKMSRNDIAAMEAMLPEPRDPREWLAVFNRDLAAGAGFLASSLDSNAPKELASMYLPRGKDPSNAELDWKMHWKIPPLDWWLTAYVRGLVSKDDFHNAAVAEGFPDEVMDKLLPIYQETVQGWMIPEMMPLNLMPADEWRSYLHYVGFGPRDAELMIKWGEAKAGAPLSQQAQDLAAVSLTNAKKMYIDGIIGKATLIEILKTHKYTDQAAVLTVDLIDQEQGMTARKNYVDGLIAEADAGLLTPQQVSDKMYAQHYTEVQVVEALNKIHLKAVGNTKHLTMSEVLDMLRYDIFSGDEAIKALIQMGYSATDALALYELEVKQHGPPAKPATTGTTGQG